MESSRIEGKVLPSESETLGNSYEEISTSAVTAGSNIFNQSLQIVPLSVHNRSAMIQNSELESHIPSSSLINESNEEDGKLVQRNDIDGDHVPSSIGLNDAVSINPNTELLQSHELDGHISVMLLSNENQVGRPSELVQSSDIENVHISTSVLSSDIDGANEEPNLIQNKSNCTQDTETAMVSNTDPINEAPTSSSSELLCAVKTHVKGIVTDVTDTGLPHVQAQVSSPFNMMVTGDISSYPANIIVIIDRCAEQQNSVITSTSTNIADGSVIFSSAYNHQTNGQISYNPPHVEPASESSLPPTVNSSAESTVNCSLQATVNSSLHSMRNSSLQENSTLNESEQVTASTCAVLRASTGTINQQMPGSIPVSVGMERDKGRHQFQFSQHDPDSEVAYTLANLNPGSFSQSLESGVPVHYPIGDEELNQENYFSQNGSCSENQQKHTNPGEIEIINGLPDEEKQQQVVKIESECEIKELDCEESNEISGHTVKTRSILMEMLSQGNEINTGTQGSNVSDNMLIDVDGFSSKKENSSTLQQTCKDLLLESPLIKMNSSQSRKLVTPVGSRLIDLECMMQALGPLLVCDCGDGVFQLQEDLRQSDWLFSALYLTCSACHHELFFPTSRISDSQSGLYDVNKRKEQAVSESGVSLEQLDRLFNIYEVPFVHKGVVPSDNETNELDGMENIPDDQDAEVFLSEQNETKPRGKLKKVVRRKKKGKCIDDSSSEVGQADKEISTHKCPVCDMHFSRKKNLVHHIKKHEGNQPHKCPTCPASFVLQNHLTKHMLTHSRKYHECQVCGKQFKKTFNLKQHIRIHTGEKPYLCSQCGKAFTDASTLNKHRKGLHQNDRRLQCEICGKSFYHQGHLNEHHRRHTGERPFSCTVCGKMFPYHDSVKKHMVVHTGFHPYHCQVCTKTFRWRESLKQHMRIHVVEKKMLNYEADTVRLVWKSDPGLSEGVIIPISKPVTVSQDAAVRVPAQEVSAEHLSAAATKSQSSDSAAVQVDQPVTSGADILSDVQGVVVGNMPTQTGQQCIQSVTVQYY